MDFVRYGARWGYLLAVVGCLAPLTARAADFTMQSGYASGVDVACVLQGIKFYCTNGTTAPQQLQYSHNGSTWASCATVPAQGTVTSNVIWGAYSSTLWAAGFYSPAPWSGLTTTNPVTAQSVAKVYQFSLRWRNANTGTNTASFPCSVTIPAASIAVTWNSGNQSQQFFAFPPITGTAVVGELFVVVDQPEPEKLCKSGVLLMDNTTGNDQVVPFGDEDLSLKPGYNSFPFYGEVDPETGFPMAMPEDATWNKVVGPDGQTYFIGRVGLGADGGAEWAAPPAGASIFPGATGSGPTIKLPNGMYPNTSDYIQLPAGMTPGASLPLPGGMTAGSDPRLPAGVTPGSSGALPSGVVSGGTVHLPDGVSAGSVAGNTGGSSGGSSGGATSGTEHGGGVSSVPDAETYSPGGSMSDMERQGIAKGKAAADALTAKVKAGLGDYQVKAKGLFGSEGFKFWSGASPLSGYDASWLSMEIPLASHTITLAVPPEWISLIRAILLWVVKIGFVMAVIRLFMK